MRYVRQPFPGNLNTVDELRRVVEEEFERVEGAASTDDLSNSTALAGIQADVVALQTDVGNLQTADGLLDGRLDTLEAQILQADDLVTNSATVALVSTTPKEVTNISIPAGTWDLFAMLRFDGAAGTVTSEVRGSIHSVTAVLDLTLPKGSMWRGGGVTDLFFPLSLGPHRVVLGSTTTYYLNAQATFITSTFGVSGFLKAKRVIV